MSLRTRVLPVEPISWATARIYGALGGRSHFLRFQRLAKMGKELGAFPAYKCLSTSTSLSEILFSAVSLRVSASPFELAPRVLLLSISRLINAESHTRQWNSALGSFPEYVESHAKRFRRFPLLFRAAGNTASSVNFPVIGSTSRFGALHSNLLDELEQTVESLARDRHLIEYAKIKFVLRARRFVTESIFLFTVGHPAFGGAQAVR